MPWPQRNDPETGEPSWYRISVPGRPNGRTGWIPAEAADLRPVDELIHIDLSARTLELWSKSRLILKTRVAIGRPGMETPPRPLLRHLEAGPAYARCSASLRFETSAYSKLSEWPGGGIVGIHGTYEPHLLGQAVSHGCVRVANRDILRLRSRVRLGTPIHIVA